MEPITREELFWAKVIGETVPDIEPVVRKEMFLARIAGMDIPAIEPITREEMFLNAIANKKTIDLEPITRREMFLAKAMGADVATPEPLSRIEFFLSQVKSNESGGSPEKPEPEEPESNAIFTADFEDGTAGKFTLGQSSAIDSEAAYSGNYGLHLQGSGTWNYLAYAYVPVEKGKTYNVRMMAKAVSGVVNVTLMDSSWMTISSQYFNKKEWASISFEITAEITQFMIYFAGGGDGTAESVYVDDIVVTEI